MAHTRNLPPRPGVNSGGSFNPNLPLAEQVLAHAQVGREVIQDFCPLADSLEWELGQHYLRERGNKAFISDQSPVPFVINNDGTLSVNAAEVLFASLTEADKAGDLEPDIYVLELGIGVGLFARFFLDRFDELCRHNQKDYYERPTYIAADKSQLMLLDVLRHGVLANHPGRFRVRLVDALSPEKVLPNDIAFRSRPCRPFRAVFLNYLLDCLPAAVLGLGDPLQQLCVRTCVGRNVPLADYTDMSVAALRQRVASPDPRAKQELLEVYGLFASEYDYRPVELKSIPYGEFAVGFGSNKTKRLLHSYGAIQCLEKLLELTHEHGFILINDYGQTQLTTQDEFEHQRFSLATFVGVNFSLLKAFFGDPDHCRWVEPPGEERGIHSRLLGHQLSPEAVLRFTECFSQAALDQLQQSVQRARECVRVGRFELAATCYHEALRRQPRNWVLMNEVSMFLTFSLRNPKAGADMAKAALALNPTCSAELWNTLGDALYEWGRTAEACSAYMKARALNSTDVRARYNLAWTYAREKDFPAALQVIAEALALDKMGEYRERLLQKQSEVLAQQAVRNQQEQLLLVNLVSKFTRPKDQDKPEDLSPTPPQPLE